MPFDVQGARAAGYSDAEIADEMAKDASFDTAGARAAGYSDAEIIAELEATPGEPASADLPAQQPIDTPERQAQVAELQRRTQAADAAGRKLEREETIAGIARPILGGLTIPADTIVGIPRLLNNLAVSGANKAFGTDIPQAEPFTSARLAPQTTGERYAGAAASALAGGLVPIAAGQQLLTSGSQLARNVGGALVANPQLQAAQALTGGTSSELARDAGFGEAGQVAAGVAGSLIPSAGLGVANKIATGVSRTPEAQRLLDRGVDLTPGQLNPRGRVNQIEEGTQSIGLVGPTIRAGRDNARSTFQRAAIQEGAAPGTTIKQAEPASMLDEAYESFRPLYDQAKGFPASPVIVNTTGPNTPLLSAIKQAVRAPSILATKDQRKAVLGYLEDQLTKGVRSSDDLLNIRSSIRDKARAAKKAVGKEEQAELLDAADEVLTRALQSQLPAKPLQVLNTADGKYGDYKTVESAVARAKDRPGGFTPNDVSEAVAQSSTSRGGYARGGGGVLRELASDARNVLDSRSPPTGARLLALSPGAAAATIDPVTGLAVQGATTAGVVLGAATQTGRRLAAGATAPQRAILRQLQQRGLVNPGLPYSALAGQLSPTAQLLQDMIGIPKGAPASPFLGLEEQQQDLRRAGLYQ